jgi:molybdate transport system substrate-binding protein
MPEPTAIKILSGGAMRSLMTEIIPLFERATGIVVETEFRLTSVLMKDIENGAPFDVALMPRAELDALERGGRIEGGSTKDITRSAVGLAVRAGAARPDISTVAAFKSALLRARSIAYSDGPSGAYIAALLERLGIAAEMKPRTRLTSGPVADLVARGEAEIGMQQIVAILPVEGADLVGPLPSELQNVIVYAAGIAVGVACPASCRAFLAFMGTPEATNVIRAKGMEPG